MFVAIPTAIPVEPLTSRLGNFEGKTVGSRIGLASRGILIGSQVLALTLGLFKTTFQALDLVVIVLDAVLIPYTVFLLKWKK